MENIKSDIKKMNDFFNCGVTMDINFRIAALKKLKAEIIKNEHKINEALNKDLSKHPFEAYATEIGIVLHEISYTLKHIRKWAKAKKVRTPLMHFISKSWIYNHPYGVALIISPWNYPFQLTLAPLIGAIAAGNCVIIKPSEFSVHTSEVIQTIINTIFPPEYIKVLTGGLEISQALLAEKFDYIFFTGSEAVGKIVMNAASQYLTPVTLELGGKSPCIIDHTAKVDLAAKRLVWGKFVNAGQTCVAPDYVYLHSSIKDQFLQSVKKYILRFYGENPHTNPDFVKIISPKHFERLTNFLSDGKLEIGGRVNVNEMKIEPTILSNLRWSDAIMKEEIFGPLLPIFEFEDLNQVITQIQNQPKPLALYLFSTDSKIQKKILQSLNFGGGCINDTIVHLATPYMPFGGVGTSGIGGYHGKASFLTFSHQKSILKKSNALDIYLRYPPYKHSIKMIKMFLK